MTKLTPSTTGWFRVEGLRGSLLSWVRGHIPPKDRFYQDQYWLVKNDHLFPLIRMSLFYKEIVDFSEFPQEVKDLVVKAQGTWQQEDQQFSPVKKLARSLDEDYRTLHLQPNAPPDIVEAVWRHVAKTHHPDKGGDSSTFVRYSEAYQRLRSMCDKRHT